jgi:SAM-dependent methyltransferase
MNDLVVRAPRLWPLLRSPMRRFFDSEAPRWADRDRSAPEYLAPLASALLNVKPEPERALDVGTGTGEGALLVAREFPTASVRGIDLSEEMIRRAQTKIGLDPDGRVAFRVADAAALPYDDDSFDLITHLNMPPFFGEIARVLRPGGSVIVASSWGPATPFYTANAVLERKFERGGFVTVRAGEVAAGTFYVGRLADEV